MNPNYESAVAKAYDTRIRFGLSDPLRILRRLHNVLVISYDSIDLPVDQDAFTCVDQNKYIVIYNSSLSPSRLRSALARELGHVVLQHDGSGPEEIWDEEATCFAYHFLCPPPSVCISVKYRPDRATVSMSFKDMQTFDSMLALKEAIAEEQTRVARFVGRNETYSSNDVEIRNLHEKDIFGHWNNYSSVLVSGKPVGYCGE
jgi:hypothetical protein